LGLGRQRLKKADRTVIFQSEICRFCLHKIPSLGL
jgi:hypothetical protein